MLETATFIRAFPTTGETADERERVLEAGREILELCVAVGGTISGEHGIGTEKSSYMGLLFTDADLSLMQAVRDVWNPRGLCNPGKLFPTSSGCGEAASLPSVAAGARDVDLKDLLGEVGARPPSSDDARDPLIDGLSPSLVLEPDDDETCARALALCHQEDMAVVPVGGATRLELGNVPSRLDVYLKTSHLEGVEDHIPGDLTVSVRAGTTLEALQQELARANQFLPLEVPNPSRATIGGILAIGEPGLRRRPGARARDLLLGFEAVLADGARVKAGGRVVKNVAGYELMKLFVGSSGTLAVMTRAFLRLRALPEETRDRRASISATVIRGGAGVA